MRSVLNMRNFGISSGQNFSWYFLSVPVQSKVNGLKDCKSSCFIFLPCLRKVDKNRGHYLSLLSNSHGFTRDYKWIFTLKIFQVDALWSGSDWFKLISERPHPFTIVNLWLIFESLLLISLTLILSI